MNCSYCDLPIKAGQGHHGREDLHPFCYEIIKGEFMDELDAAIRADPNYVEICPGVFQHRDYVERPESGSSAAH